MSKYAPAFSGDPVILIHLVGPDGNAACCGEPFIHDQGSYQNIPRVLCYGCVKEPNSPDIQFVKLK